MLTDKEIDYIWDNSIDVYRAIEGLSKTYNYTNEEKRDTLECLTYHLDNICTMFKNKLLDENDEYISEINYFLITNRRDIERDMSRCVYEKPSDNLKHIGEKYKNFIRTFLKMV